MVSKMAPVKVPQPNAEKEQEYNRIKVIICDNQLALSILAEKLFAHNIKFDYFMWKEHGKNKIPTAYGINCERVQVMAKSIAITQVDGNSLVSVDIDTWMFNDVSVIYRRD